MAFNPILETNIQPMQSAQKPSAGAAAADLFSGLFPNLGNKPSPVSRTDVEARARQDTLRELQIAADTHDPTRATTAYRNHAAQFGVGTFPEVDSAFSAVSGMDPLRTGFGSDDSLATIKANPDYPMQRELARTRLPSTASQQDVENEAIRLTQTAMANDAKIKSLSTQETVDWYALKPAYETKTRELMTTAQDMISQIQRDHIISVEDARGIREWYTNNLANIVKPANVSEKDWNEWKTSNITPIELVINTSLDNLLKGGQSDDMNRALKDILDVAIARGKLNPSVGVILGNPNADPTAKMAMLTALVGDDPSKASYVRDAQNVLGMTYEQQLAWVQDFETADIGFIKGRINTSEFTGLTDPAAKEASLMSDVVMMSSSDPGESATALINLSEKLKSIPDTVITADFLNSMFTPTFFNQVEKLHGINAPVTEEIMATTKEALGNHMASMEAHIMSIAKQNGFTIAANGTGQYNFVLSREVMTPEAQRELDTYFGGSIAAAEKARGIFSETINAGTRAAGILRTPNLSSAFKDIDRAKEELNKYGKLMDMFNKLDGKLNPSIPEHTQASEVSRGGTGASVVETGAGYTVIKLDDGTTVRREGTRAWRNNNPGNIEYGDFAKRNGAIGTDGRFAVFPTVEDGRRARASLLFESAGYKNLTIGEAIARYAPSSENDTNGYTSAITSALGLPASTKLSDLGPDERAVMQNAMERVEGFTPGKENGVQAYDVAQDNPRPTMAGTAATGPFIPNPVGGPTASVTAPSPAPIVSGTDYQPATISAPEAIPQVTNTNPAPTSPAAVQTPYDAEVQSFIDAIKNGYESAKGNASLQFNSYTEIEDAKAAGKIKEGDIVMLKGKPIMVY